MPDHHSSKPSAPHYPHLFTPGTIGSVSIPNRVVQLPMGTSLIDHGRVTERDVLFQEERARGGVGLIITGAAIVHPTSRFPERIITEAWDEGGVEMLRSRVRAVQRHGTRMFGQILHLGREQPGGQNNYFPLAPSPIPSPRDPGVPHEMSTAEVRMIVDAFGASAANFKAAGYDGVEVHAAHGYLVAQFLSQASNRRTDAYRGDTLEGRTRFLLELIQEIRTRCGAGYPIGVRLSAVEETPDGLTLDDTLEIVDTLQSAAPVDYVSITAGMRNAYVKDSAVPEGFILGFTEAVKRAVDVPVIAAGRFRHPGLAETALASRQADFIGLGRSLIADPDWATKARNGHPEQIRPCVGFVQDCRIALGGLACAVNARAGREADWGPRSGRAATRRRVVVAGAGPAGLEAARLAADYGHDVVLYERQPACGGQVRVAAAGPTRGELLDFITYLESEVTRLGVDVRLGTAATKPAILADTPDLVVSATGARPLVPSFPFDTDAAVVSVWDLLAGAVTELPRRAVVVDDLAGFWHAISAAEFLAERGVEVELLTPARAVGLAIPPESVAGVHQRLGRNGVRVRPFVKVTGVEGTTICVAETLTGEPSRVSADLVVVRTSLRVNDELLHELEGDVPALAVVGDCAAPRRITHAVLDANMVIRQFNAGQLSAVPMPLF
jgi:2,4-dienoyl-CoA reductase-like NADH-dependent reductase (Old Yellow Enzyme family)